VGREPVVAPGVQRRVRERRRVVRDGEADPEAGRGERQRVEDVRVAAHGRQRPAGVRPEAGLDGGRRPRRGVRRGRRPRRGQRRQPATGVRVRTRAAGRPDVRDRLAGRLDVARGGEPEPGRRREPDPEVGRRDRDPRPTCQAGGLRVRQEPVDPVAAGHAPARRRASEREGRIGIAAGLARGRVRCDAGGLLSAGERRRAGRPGRSVAGGVPTDRPGCPVAGDVRADPDHQLVVVDRSGLRGVVANPHPERDPERPTGGRDEPGGGQAVAVRPGADRDERRPVEGGRELRRRSGGAGAHGVTPRGVRPRSRSCS